MSGERARRDQVAGVRLARRALRLLAWGSLVAALALPGITGLAAARIPPEQSAEALRRRPAIALRRAVEALEARDHQRAERLLIAVALHQPVIADHADRLRLRVLLEAGRLDDAVLLAGEAVAQHGDSTLLAEFHRLRAEAYAVRGDEEAGRASWDLALAATRDSEDAAALRAAVAASFERSGDLAAAGEQYLVLWTNAPTTPEGEDADVRLDALEKHLDAPLRTAASYRKRGDAFFRKRRTEEALDAYDRALAGELSDADRRRAERKRGHSFFRLRRYDEAATTFAALEQDDEIRIWHARAVARAGDVPTAVRELERIAGSARREKAAHARLLAAMLLEGQGMRSRARELYAKVANQRRRTPYRPTALWRLAWNAYLEGRDRDALRHLRRVIREEDDPIAALRARYWHALVSERVGAKDADAQMLAIAVEYPLSYYGWRAQARVSGAHERPEPIRVARGRSALAPREFEAARILLEAGLEDEARAELGRLFPRARSLSDRLELAHLYTQAGSFDRAQRLVLDAYPEPLARGPSPEHLELWWYSWPTAFHENVNGSSLDGTLVEPSLVYAVMREESGYRPDAVSPNGAMGLLQLMPETAARVARRIGMRRYSEDDLFEPNLNIKLGSAYLVELMRRFGGRTSAAIGGYNAGPTAVAGWLRESTAESDDEWVESIPYDQTRSYVKRVLRSLHAYRVLY